MNKSLCPNCGATIRTNGVCPYCGNTGCGASEYSSQLEASKRKREIKMFRQLIAKEQNEIDKILKDTPPNGCLKYGIGVIVVAIVFAIVLSIFRMGDGVADIFLGLITFSILIYVVCRYCDKEGNKDTAKKIKQHKKKIKEYNNEIEMLGDC